MSKPNYYNNNAPESASSSITNHKRFPLIIAISVGFLLLLLSSLFLPKFQDCFSSSSSSSSSNKRNNNNNNDDATNLPQNNAETQSLDNHYKTIFQKQKELFPDAFNFIYGGNNEQESAENERIQHEKEGEFYTGTKYSGGLQTPELSETNTIS